MDNLEANQPETKTSWKDKLRRNRAGRAVTALAISVASLAGASGPAMADAPPTPNTPVQVTDAPTTPNVPSTANKPAPNKSGLVKVEANHHMRSVAEITRHEQRLNPEIVKARNQATLEVLMRPKNADGTQSNEAWQPAGTSTLEQAGIVVTAGHVVGDTTGHPYGSIFSPDPSIKAYDVTSLDTKYDYAVADPKAPLWYRKTHPIGYVVRIKQAAEGTDEAALQIVDSQIIQTKGRALPQIPTLKLQFVPTAPKLGTPVSLYGIPAANGSKPIEKEGIFIRREKYTPRVNPGEVSRGELERDVVAVLAPSPEEDVCGDGSSGVKAVTSTGKLGVLTTRNNVSHRVVQNNDNSLTGMKRDRDTLQQQSGVSFPNNYTICYFTVPPPETEAALLSDTPAPPPPSS